MALGVGDIPVTATPGMMQGMSSGNALVDQYLKNVVGSAQAQYAPQTVQADIFNKKFAPLAQIASNPIAMAMMGDRGQGVMNAITQLLQQQNPSPAPSTSNSLMGMLTGLFNRSNALNGAGGASGAASAPPGNALNQPAGGMSTQQAQGASANNQQSPASDESGNYTQPVSNFPTGSTPGENLAQRALAPGNEQMYPAGTPYIDKNGEYKVTAAPTTLGDNQVGMGAIQSVKPMLEELQKEGDYLLKPGKNIKWFKSLLGVVGEGVGVSPERLEKLKISPDYYNDYVQFQKNQNDAAAKLGLVYKYGNNIEGESKAMSQVTPAFGEDDKAYHKRMDTELKKLEYQNKVYKGQVTGGFNVSPNAGIETPPSPFAEQKTGQQSVNKNLPPEGKIEKTKVINNIQYVRIKGKWYPYA